MAVELDTGLPSTRQVQNIIREKKTVEIKLTTGDVLNGQIQWQDPNCICVLVDGNSTVQVRHHAIAYIKQQV